jgi:hypothetical protein
MPRMAKQTPSREWLPGWLGRRQVAIGRAIGSNAVRLVARGELVREKQPRRALCLRELPRGPRRANSCHRWRLWGSGRPITATQETLGRDCGPKTSSHS